MTAPNPKKQATVDEYTLRRCKLTTDFAKFLKVKTRKIQQVLTRITSRVLVLVLNLTIVLVPVFSVFVLLTVAV